MKKGLLIVSLGLMGSLLISGFWMYRPANSFPPSSSSIDEKLSETSGSMTLAAQELMESLSEAQKKLALFPFASQERSNWHFTPVRRKGLMWEQMDESQRSKLTALLKTTLSESGYQKLQEVRGLELVLREVEGRGPHDRYRHPDRYFLSIFGTPSARNPGAGASKDTTYPPISLRSRVR